MRGYLKKAQIARTLKAVTLNLPPHAHMSGDTGAPSDTAVATRPGVAVAPDQAETGNHRLVCVAPPIPIRASVVASVG